MNIKDTVQFRFGAFGEREVKRWFMLQGYGVISLAKIECGAAPSLETLNENIVLPDFQVIYRGISKYVEVKTRSTCTNYSKRQGDRTQKNRPQQRIHQYHFNEYQRIEQQSGLPVWLCFFQVDILTFYFQRISQLAQCIDHIYPEENEISKIGQGPWIFWNMTDFYKHNVSSVQMNIPPSPPTTSDRILHQKVMKNVKTKYERTLFDDIEL